MMTTLLHLERSVRVDLKTCDRCCASAAQAFAKDNFVLAFCQHHTNQYETNMVLDGWHQLNHPKNLDNPPKDGVKLSVDSNHDDDPDAGVPAKI